MDSRHRYSSLLVLGAPGSGRSTQGRTLGRIPRFHHVTSAEVFHSLDMRTPLGSQFVQYSRKGLLVPEEFTVHLWRAHIRHLEEAHRFKSDIDLLVLDGIPRSLAQARLMDAHLDVVQVFHLECDNHAELTRRLRKRALKDNRFEEASEKVIQQRLATYEEESKPLLDHYTGRVTHVDASQPPARVLLDILTGVMRLPLWQKRSRIEI